mgnify:CR=1 FL=1
MKRSVKRIVYNIVIFSLLLTGLVVVCYKFLHLGNVEYTDNATVCQHITPVNTRVAGFIREIRFEENQAVKAGDTLVVIEDAEFRLHLAQAEAELANAQAGHRVTSAGIATTESNISVNDASIEEARAQMENADKENMRYGKLLAEGAVTQQQYDNVHTAFVAAKARYEQASRGRNSSALVKREQGVRLEQNAAAVNMCEANVRLARLNLSYCAIIATCDGVTGRKTIHAARTNDGRHRRLKGDVGAGKLQGVADVWHTHRLGCENEDRRRAWCGIRRNGRVAFRCHRVGVILDAVRQCNRKFCKGGTACAGAHIAARQF